MVKNNRRIEKYSLSTMKDFVEGKISTIEFWNIYKENYVIQNMLIHDKKRKKGVYVYDENTKTMKYDKTKTYDYFYYFNPESLLKVIDISILEHRLEVYNIVRNYFLRRKKRYKYYNNDEEFYNLLQEILPEWLDVTDENILIDIWMSSPNDLNKDERIAICKKKVLEFFRYKDYPPRWIQNCEWPIVNGKPLIFVKQEDDINNGNTKYFFYNEYDNNTIIIKQND